MGKCRCQGALQAAGAWELSWAWQQWMRLCRLQLGTWAPMQQRWWRRRPSPPCKVSECGWHLFCFFLFSFALRAWHVQQEMGVQDEEHSPHPGGALRSFCFESSVCLCGRMAGMRLLPPASICMPRGRLSACSLVCLPDCLHCTVCRRVWLPPAAASGHLGPWAAARGLSNTEQQVGDPSIAAPAPASCLLLATLPLRCQQRLANRQQRCQNPGLAPQLCNFVQTILLLFHHPQTNNKANENTQTNVQCSSIQLPPHCPLCAVCRSSIDLLLDPAPGTTQRSRHSLDTLSELFASGSGSISGIRVSDGRGGWWPGRGVAAVCVGSVVGIPKLQAGGVVTSSARCLACL